MSRPGCTVEGCTAPADYKILHDDRLTDQYRCTEHVIDELTTRLPNRRNTP